MTHNIQLGTVIKFMCCFNGVERVLITFWLIYRRCLKECGCDSSSLQSSGKRWEHGNCLLEVLFPPVDTLGSLDYSNMAAYWFVTPANHYSPPLAGPEMKRVHERHTYTVYQSPTWCVQGTENDHGQNAYSRIILTSPLFSVTRYQFKVIISVWSDINVIVERWKINNNNCY